MAHPLAGADGFLRYIALRSSGTSQEEIRSTLLKKRISRDGSGFEEATTAIEEELRKQTADRESRTTAAFKEAEILRSHMTEAGKTALDSLKKGHITLLGEEGQLKMQIDEMISFQLKRNEEIKKAEMHLAKLKSGLSSTPTDPTWISLDQLRARGREYAIHQTRKV